MTLAEVSADYEQRLQATVEHARKELTGLRAGRATPSLVESVEVELYGQRLPLRQVATVSAPEARLLTLAPFDPSAMAAIERAVQAANLGLNPQNDGRLIRLPVPPLTEERRRELVKQAKALVERHRNGLRDQRNSGLKRLKEVERQGGVSQDELRRAEARLKELAEARAKDLNALIEAKERELLEP